MKYILSLLIFSIFSVNAFSQNNPPLPKDAKLEGTIVHLVTKQPRNNELIIFKSQKNSNEYQAISDSMGKFSTRVPVGDKYEIFILGFKDSTSYNFINIPMPAANGYYHKPFTINLEFEPAKTFVLENVEFDFGKATLRSASYKTLDDLVEYLERRANEKIEIGGHTDNIGSEAKNKILSLERAKSIVAYLESKGIDPNRLTAKGYGSMEPIEENTTEAGRQMNRRSEVKILEQD